MKTGFATPGRRRDFAQLLRQSREVAAAMHQFDIEEAEASGFRFSGLLEKLEQQALAYEEPYRIAVIGEFKAGKSTFINSLLGRRKFLPEAGTETTAVLTELLSGSEDAQEYGEVLFRDKPALTGLPLGEALRYADKRNPVYATNPDLKGSVDRIRLHLQAPLLRNVVLIDTPGLGKSKDQQQRTLDTLHTADAILWVFDANRIGGELAFDVLHRAAELKAKLTVVLSQSDHRVRGATAQERAEQRQAILKDLQCSDVAKVVGGCSAFTYSSEQVLAATDRGDAQALAEWGQTELLAHLRTEYLSDAAPTAHEKLEKARGTLKRLLTDALEALEAAKLRRDTTASSIQTQLSEAQQRVHREVHPRIPGVEQKLEDVASAEAKDFFADLEKALEVLIEDKMDLSVDSIFDAVRTVYGRFNEEVKLENQNALVREFRVLFPVRREEALRRELRTKAERVLRAEWQAAAEAVVEPDSLAAVELTPLLQDISKHLIDVMTKVAATIASAVALVFVPGGVLYDLLALVASGGMLRSASGKGAARTERAKNKMRLQLRNHRKLFVSDVCAKLYEVNEQTAGRVEAKLLEHAGEWQREVQKALADAERYRAWYGRLERLVREANEFEGARA